MHLLAEVPGQRWVRNTIALERYWSAGTRGKGDGEILTERVFRNTKLTGHRDIFLPGLDPKADLKELVSKKVLQTDSPVLQMPELEPFELRRT